LRLLLDEHFSPAIAAQLQRRGHDVVAAAERTELKNQEDQELLRWAVGERRTLVSENATDFIELHGQCLTRGQKHYSIILTSAEQFPRRRAGIGRLVRALDTLLRESVPEDALRLDLRWLAAG
jgi:predicted nuclease of predicted toxin-antitoxin system